MDELDRAADVIASAEALVICAGAGMGVDSGLPDFRGPEGFWRAYPPFRERGLEFHEVSNPVWFSRDPEQAWGFFGHRLNLYRKTQPHQGFEILRSWADQKPAGAFVFTSNVDGHFQRAGFSDDVLLECHGSLMHLQCVRPCTNDIRSAANLAVEVDDATFRANRPLPECAHCGGLARPNVLMFYDGNWISDRSDAQHDRWLNWIGDQQGTDIAVIECGAGTGVPTVRHFAERTAEFGRLVRINPRDPQTPRGGISIAAGAKETLQQLDDMMR